MNVKLEHPPVGRILAHLGAILQDLAKFAEVVLIIIVVIIIIIIILIIIVIIIIIIIFIRLWRSTSSCWPCKRKHSGLRTLA